MEPIEESSEVSMEQVELARKWTFWENYDPKDKSQRKDYSKLLKDIYSFNTIIDFWQFCNKYPGNRPENIFYNGERIR